MHAVESTPVPAIIYFAKANWSVLRRNGEWTGVIATYDGGGLVILTKDKKYILSCPWAADAGERIRSLYHIQRSDIEMPKVFK